MPPSFLLAQATGLQGIAEANGLAISITGMLIVFVALTGISLFIGLLPMVLRRIEPWLPETEGHHVSVPSDGALPEPEGRLIAAIGYAMHSQGRRAAGRER